jgi:hypothetical protein
MKLSDKMVWTEVTIFAPGIILDGFQSLARCEERWNRMGTHIAVIEAKLLDSQGAR